MIVDGVDGLSGHATSRLIGTSTEGLVPKLEIPSAVTACRETVDPSPGTDVRPFSKHLILNGRGQLYSTELSLSLPCKLKPENGVHPRRMVLYHEMSNREFKRLT